MSDPDKKPLKEDQMMNEQFQYEYEQHMPPEIAVPAAPP